MLKKRLFAPGPTPVPEETLLAMAQPMFHHRTAEYREMLEQLTDDMKLIMQTEQDVYTLTGSGSAAMEAAVANSVGRGEKMIAVRGGKFGERWADIGEKFGAEVVAVDVEWGTAITADEIKDLLDEHDDAVAVCVQHCETSTATVIDLEAIGKVVAKTDALLVVDGITGVGALPFYMDQWHVDITVVGSQKALMMPAGLGFVACSEKAWAKIDQTEPGCFYNDLKPFRAKLPNWDNPWTPANQLVRAALKSTAMIREEGIETVWAETKRRAEAVRAAAEAMGLDLLSSSPSDSVTAIRLPDGIDGAKFPKVMADEFGARVAGGQAQLKGKIFRVSHMGYLDDFDTLSVIAAAERSLRKLGYDVEPGTGLAAAQRVLAQV